MSSCEDEAKNPERYAGSRGSAPDDPCTFRVTVHFLACCTAVFLWHHRGISFSPRVTELLRRSVRLAATFPTLQRLLPAWCLENDISRSIHRPADVGTGKDHHHRNPASHRDGGCGLWHARAKKNSILCRTCTSFPHLCSCRAPSP